MINRRRLGVFLAVAAAVFAMEAIPSGMVKPGEAVVASSSAGRIPSGMVKPGEVVVASSSLDAAILQDRRIF